MLYIVFILAGLTAAMVLTPILCSVCCCLVL